jgi:uncharacterized phage protein gp47/JayE
MSFVRPTLSELVARVEQDFVSRLSLAGAVLRRSTIRVLARVVAGAAHMLHGHLDFLARQLFPDTAETTYLDRWAGLYGVTRNAAGFAKGTVTVTGTNGTVVPAGTTLLRADGAEYRTDAQVTIAGGSAAPAVTAVVAGADGTLTVAASMTFESPIGGINSTAAVASSTQDGTDEESDDDLRDRVVARMQSPPHGGAEADYIAWAKEVAGVTRAWVAPEELGAGTVVLRFVRDDDGDGAAIIPSAGEIAAVQTYVDERRPVTATVSVLAPVSVPLNFTVDGLTPDTAATRAAVTAELADLLRRDAAPAGTILKSQIETAVGVSEGVEDFAVTVPAADVTHTTGQIATMGTVTFT